MLSLPFGSFHAILGQRAKIPSPSSRFFHRSVLSPSFSAAAAVQHHRRSTPPLSFKAATTFKTFHRLPLYITLPSSPLQKILISHLQKKKKKHLPYFDCGYDFNLKSLWFHLHTCICSLFFM